MKINETYIVSYLKGTLTSKEIKECDVLIASSPEFSEKVNKIRKTYQLFDNLEAQQCINTEAAWKNVYRKIRLNKSKNRLWNFTRNAAAILLPLFLLQQYVIQPLLKESSIQEIITLHSSPGIVTKAVLPDGSEVWLNSQSTLTYPNQFTEKERTVELMGEAYFKVKSDKKNRFNVITPDKTVVSAYGTEFNVNAYTGNSQFIITLAKGNVDISLDNFFTKQSLTPGQNAFIDLGIDNISVSATDTYVETAWKDGKMVFRRENIKHIAEILSRKFGAAIHIEGNTSKDYQFTATFTNESLENILELLKLSNSIDYSISSQNKLPNDTFSQKTVIITCK